MISNKPITMKKFILISLLILCFNALAQDKKEKPN